jgi:hypothetical protein
VKLAGFTQPFIQYGNSIVNPNPGAVNDGRGRASLSKQNTFKVNLLQTGLVLLMNYMAVAGVVAVYKSN